MKLLLITQLLTSLKNGIKAKKASIFVKYSNTNLSILKILKEHNKIKNYSLFKDKNFLKLKINLEYNKFGCSNIKLIKLISKPSNIVNVNYKTIYNKIDFLKKYPGSFAIISTSAGIIDNKYLDIFRLGGYCICCIF